MYGWFLQSHTLLPLKLNMKWIFLTFIDLMKILKSFLLYNWLIQPFSLDCNPVSHTTYVVSVNFIHDWRDIQFIFDCKQLYNAILFTSRAVARNLQKSPKQYFLILLFVRDAKAGIWSNKPTHYLLDYGNFESFYWPKKIFFTPS